MHQGHNRTSGRMKMSFRSYQSRGETRASQLQNDAKIDLSPHSREGVWTCAHTCTHVCLCKCVRAASGAATWPGGEGLWCVSVCGGVGVSFSEPWPHLTLLSPKSLERVTAGCRLADGVEDKLSLRQTAEAEKRKSDSGREIEEKAHKGANGD